MFSIKISMLLRITNGGIPGIRQIPQIAPDKWPGVIEVTKAAIRSIIELTTGSKSHFIRNAIIARRRACGVIHGLGIGVRGEESNSF